MSSDMPQEVIDRLAPILTRDAFARWWTKPMDAFEGKTPQDTWKTDPQKVLDRIDGYGEDR